jgi:hypothetical protein
LGWRRNTSSKALYGSQAIFRIIDALGSPKRQTAGTARRWHGGPSGLDPVPFGASGERQLGPQG